VTNVTAGGALVQIRPSALRPPGRAAARRGSRGLHPGAGRSAEPLPATVIAGDRGRPAAAVKPRSAGGATALDQATRQPSPRRRPRECLPGSQRASHRETGPARLRPRPRPQSGSHRPPAFRGPDGLTTIRRTSHARLVDAAEERFEVVAARRFGPIDTPRPPPPAGGPPHARAAPAPGAVQVVLDPAGCHEWDLQLLVRPRHTQVRRATQLCAARHAPAVVIDHLVRHRPRHACAACSSRVPPLVCFPCLEEAHRLG
jgi:hypothetical protein